MTTHTRQIGCWFFLPLLLNAMWCISPLRLDAQLVVDNSVTAVNGVQNILLGEGITVSNITWSGTNEQIGSFDCVNCNVGLASGLVMGSGNVNGAAGPNSSGTYSLGPASGFGASDPDLSTLSGFSLNDAAVLQFDFVPTGDSLAFNFVFASDEYPEFANGNFNDVFGFFLSGPGITGPYSNNSANIALIPGSTLPVTINNVNNGTTGTGGPCEFCAYYNHNGTGSTAPQNASNFYIQGDGFTTVLTAFAEVICGETYHIKLAIADAGDQGYDSWVFLQEGSFQSNQLQVAYSGPEISPGENSVYEGCQPGELIFTRPAGVLTEVTYNVMVSGTAQSGVDFEPLPASITFPPLSTIASMQLVTIADGITEGIETVTVEISGAASCNNEGITYELQIVDLPPLDVQLNDVQINCGESVTLTPQISGGIGYYTVLWEVGGMAPSFTVAPPFDMTYNYTVLDTCGVTPYAGAVNVTFPDYAPIVVDIGSNQTLTCLDPLDLTSLVSGGFGAYSYAWTSGGGVLSDQPDMSLPAAYEATFTLSVTDECGAEGSADVTVDIPPVPVTADIGDDTESTCLDVISLTAAVSGGIGAYSYSWSYNNQYLGNAVDQNIATAVAGTVNFEVTDECGNTASDALQVTLPALPVAADAGEDEVATCLDQVQLTASASGGVGNYTYVWTYNSGLVSQTANASYQGDEDATYVVTITDQCGNTDIDQVTISIPPVPVVVDAGPDVSTTCIDPVTLNGTVSGGVGAYSYNWYSPNAVLGANSSVIVDTNIPLQVTLEVTDQCGNTGSDDLQILIPLVPITLQITQDTLICIGDQLILKANAEGGVGELSYSWQHDGSSNQQLVIAPAESLVYTVTVEDICGNTNSASVSVGVDIVEPGFTAAYNGEFGIELTNQSQNAVDYIWIFSDGTTSSEEDVNHTFLDLNPWEVTLIAIGELGCAQEYSETFHPPGNIYIPNCFTADNDGINDVFQVKGHDIAWFKIWIFNRWGDVVYYSESMDEVWDGSDKGGDYHGQDGQYVYRIEAQGIRGNSIEKEGLINLIR